MNGVKFMVINTVTSTLLFFIAETKQMKRPLFILLLFVPIIGAFFFSHLKFYLLFAVLYIWTLQTIRLRYVGVEWRDIAIASTPFGVKYWWKMWEKDPALN